MISDGVAEPRSPVERNHLYSCFKCVRTLRCKAWALVWNYTCPPPPPPTNIHISVTINPVTPLPADQRLSILYLFQRRVSEFIINPATRCITCRENLKKEYLLFWLRNHPNFFLQQRDCFTDLLKIVNNTIGTVLSVVLTLFRIAVFLSHFFNAKNIIFYNNYDSLTSY